VRAPVAAARVGVGVGRGAARQSGVQYRVPGSVERGFTTAVSAMAAIERGVFEERKRSLGESVRAMRENFREERVRQELLRAPKWGNDDPRADRWALAWLELRERIRKEAEEATGTGRHVSQHVVRSLHHIDGRRIGASADGRLAFAPCADSIGAQTGTARKGPTAILSSVMKLRPRVFWPAGYNLNLTLPLGRISDEEGIEKLIAMVDAFFSGGGQELQIACLDARILREAQEQPEKHADVLVRIAGFNALFVRLSPAEQEEIIQRAESRERGW